MRIGAASQNPKDVMIEYYERRLVIIFLAICPSAYAVCRQIKIAASFQIRDKTPRLLIVDLLRHTASIGTYVDHTIVAIAIKYTIKSCFVYSNRPISIGCDAIESAHDIFIYSRGFLVKHPESLLSHLALFTAMGKTIIKCIHIGFWFGLCACGSGARLSVWCSVGMRQKSEPLASSAATFTALPNRAEDAIATHGKPFRHRPWRCAWSYEKHSRSLCAIGWTRW